MGQDPRHLLRGLRTQHQLALPAEVVQPVNIVGGSGTHVRHHSLPSAQDGAELLNVQLSHLIHDGKGGRNERRNEDEKMEEVRKRKLETSVVVTEFIVS